MRVKSSVRTILDNDRRRWLLQFLGSAYLTTTRGPCWVSRRDGRWVHHYRSQAFVSPSIGGQSPAMLDRTTRDVYLWGYTPKYGDVVVDVGSGIGTEVPTFSRLVGSAGRVLAVEAHPTIFEYLVANVTMNNLSNVTPLNLAIAGELGRVRITDDLDDHLSNTIVAVDDGIDVEAETLDGLVATHGLETIDFLRMNIEGAEVMALQGGREALARTRYLCVCCHDFRADRTGEEAMRTFGTVSRRLQDAGFDLAFRRDDPRPDVRDTVYGSRR